MAYVAGIGPIKEPPAAILASAHLRPWFEHYQAEGLYRFDPVLTQARGDVLPFLWGDLASARSHRGPARDVAAEAAAWGLRFGHTVPLHGPGADCAAFSVMGNVQRSRGVFQRLTASQQDFLHLLAVHFHARYTELAATTSQPAVRHPLSPREIDCLNWSARGKTARETAAILSLSANTVTWHLDCAKRKLDVATKSHAIAQAIRLGYVSP